MKYSEETKYHALSLLASGKDNSFVAAETDVNLATVIRWNKQLQQAKLNGEVDGLIDMDKAVLTQVIAEVKEKNPSIGEAAGQLTENLDYSKRLSKELQLTAMHVAQQAKSFALSAQSAGDLIAIADVICSLQTAFFNSNSTQVNIQNNHGTPYAGFLDDKPEGVVASPIQEPAQ